ncbi:protein translocase subunit SecF [Candidatus Palibaumannia cicadellinicola]|uniref:Protein-export membrane protein SecF n=1 Tax=Candidatus Palibaumannia cicadellinicola TaxID=186490 RepID=A0A0K2BLR0_9GAMM|nr:protein translocase subunit SecF [Candidatus Baumannia cicadellinicola]AKZ66124.1 Protein-export membrane protein [Candidatus Baumannia cicadellinicola]
MIMQNSIEELTYGHKIYNFMRWSYIAFMLSIITFIASITVIFLCGFNLGLDFTGGTVIELKLEKTTDINKIREAIQHAVFRDPIVQYIGNNKNIIVRIPPVEENTEKKLGNKVLRVIDKVTNQKATLTRLEYIGPNVSYDILSAGIISLLLAIICIFIYVVVRFEWRLATGTVIALIHDVVITLGLLSLFHLEIELTIIAALISVIGYSLNDSIVVSDRIRENFRKISSINTNAYEIFNISLTQTLSRTMITSAITMMVVLILLIFGGSMLRVFSITLLTGVFIGTISSIYVASALALKLGMKREHIMQQQINKESI